jgi:hypothetical protein
MSISLLNLISTPVPVLNTLGLSLRVGLSSEDPKVFLPSEHYDAYLSVYSPEGILLDRLRLGQIPPNRRKFFEVSAITRKLVGDVDHLTVVHRVPSRLLAQGTNVEDEIELPNEADYFLFRSLIEYSFPQGGNGSVIYETPRNLNLSASSNTLSFTCQIVLSESVNSYVVLVNYSMDRSYSRIANYKFAIYSLAGALVATDQVAIGPFGIKVLDMARVISSHQIGSCRDPQDGTAAFTFIGYSDDAALLMMTVSASPSLGAVSVEHTHPPQAYLFPSQVSQQRVIKADAQEVWMEILSKLKADQLP